jgi:hypothetical protein
VQIGQDVYRAANVSKAPEDFQRAMPRSSSSPTARRPRPRASSSSAPRARLRPAAADDRAVAQSCEAVGNARTAFNTAQANIGPAGRANPQLAQQLLAALGQLSPIPEQFAKALKCGTATSSR